MPLKSTKPEASTARRRFVVSFGIALVLGLCSTVAVAWAFAISVNTIIHRGDMLGSHTAGSVWNVQEYRWFGTRSTSWTPFTWLVTSDKNELASFDVECANLLKSMNIPRTHPVIASEEQLVNTGTAPPTLIEHERGWPFLALGCAAITDPGKKVNSSSQSPSPASLIAGVVFTDSGSVNWDVDMFALPLKPLFPGFYLDTALYASLWWAALFWRPLRRRRRIARGQCPACAYSLAGLPAGADKCPECGSPMP